MTEPVAGKRRIAAVFATMNRRDTAVACVKRLAAQSRPPEEVRIADNGSNDGTVEALEALKELPFELTVIRMPGNAGNAGGVERAMDEAFEGKVDAVWILDDDSLPRLDALGRLLGGSWNGKTVRHPIQIDPSSGGMTWPLQVMDASGGWALISRLEDLPDEECFESRASWTGALIPREVREKTGPVNGALFIRGEDEEYPLRIARAGFRFEAVREAVLDHPAPAELVTLRFLGRSFFLEPDLPDWKLHYKVRNMIWIKKTYVGPLAALMMALAYFVGVIRVDGPGGGRIDTLVRAVFDGWRGRLGPLETRTVA